jgi:hypothetical protein
VGSFLLLQDEPLPRSIQLRLAEAGGSRRRSSRARVSDFD